MKKIRIGNDFVFSWAIERGGIPEPLETVLEKQLYMIVSGIKTKIDDYIVSENNVIIEFTPEMLSKLGVYTLVFTYILPDTSLSDNDRKCAVDIDAFQIVPKTAMADDVSEFAVTSDMAIAFKGEKGDSAYQVWLNENPDGTFDDYFEWLRQPATEAAELANAAAILANTKAGEANIAATLANTKAGEANIAATLANEARLAIEGDLTTINENIGQLSNGVIDDEEVIATDLNELSARVSALEAAFRNMIISKMQIDSIDVLKDLNYQGRPLFIVSNVAPNIAPDGVPQFWINTSNGDLYSAQNVNSVASWKLK